MTQEEKKPEDKWIVKTHTSSMGETGDYETTVWIENGNKSLYVDGFSEIDDYELQEIADQLNEFATLTARVEELTRENAKLSQEVKSLKAFEANIIPLYEEIARENARLTEQLKELNK